MNGALYALLPKGIAAVVTTDTLCEIRLRAGKPVTVFDGKLFRQLTQEGLPVLTAKSDIEYVLGVASGWSRYAIDDELARGYVRYAGGIRVGAAGEGVFFQSGFSTLKNVSSLVIRVPAEVKGCADGVIDKVFTGGEFKNTLVVSPTAGGKTTLLREIARLTSNGGLNTVVIDERFELAASFNGVCGLDVGINTDVLSGVPKAYAYENAIRSLNPDVIITDEVYTEAEVEAISEAVRAGARIAASVHSDGEDVLSKGVFKGLRDIVDTVIVLSKKRCVGEIVKVISRA